MANTTKGKGDARAQMAPTKPKTRRSSPKRSPVAEVPAPVSRRAATVRSTGKRPTRAANKPAGSPDDAGTRSRTRAKKAPQTGIHAIYSGTGSDLNVFDVTPDHKGGHGVADDEPLNRGEKAILWGVALTVFLFGYVFGRIVG